MKPLLPLIPLSLLLFASTSLADTLVTINDAKSLIIFPERNAPAQVVALNKTQVPAEISTTLESLTVNVGDMVNKGQKLAQLDCRNPQWLLDVEKAKHQQLSTQLAFERRELKRAQQLGIKKNVSATELDNRETSIRTHLAQIAAQDALTALAQENVKRCQVTAPFSGVITKRLANEGEMLSTGQALVEILQHTHSEISAQIAISDEPSFLGANDYSLLVNNKSYPLTLLAVVPYIEKSTLSKEARLTFKAQSATIGSTGRLHWRSPNPHLPAHLLQTRKGINGFFMSQNKTAKFVEVPHAEEGRPIPYPMEAYPLAENPTIILDGRLGLNDGENITQAKPSLQEN